MTKRHLEAKRLTGDKEVNKTTTEEATVSNNNRGKTLRVTLINSQRILLSSLGNQRQMILTIRKQAKQTKVRLALVEINTRTTRIREWELKRVDRIMLMLSRIFLRKLQWVGQLDSKRRHNSNLIKDLV
jgi:ferredoxin-fold anticodon binding domain-containing protein